MSEIDAVLETLYHPGLKRIDPGLERVFKFLEALGNPQMRLPPVIHVAGTNGKGSLVAYLQGVLEAAGLRVHRYISPHLVRFNERILLAGEEIADEELLALLLKVQALAQDIPVTYFEATTAAAFLAFAAHEADVALLETGMGGRLDATNVIEKPLLTAITPIALDHMEFLGEMLEAIASEKAGILKPGVMCVVGPQEKAALQVIRRVAEEVGAPLFVHGEDWHVAGVEYRSAAGRIRFTPALHGAHQFANAGTAIACAEKLRSLRIPSAALVQGISRARWAGRLQHLGEDLWLDGGHNAHAGEALAAWAGLRQDKPLVVICGMSEKKDPMLFLAPLAPHISRLIAIAIPGEPLSLPVSAVSGAARALGLETVEAGGLEEAVQLAAAHGPARVLICGSLYLAGKVLSWRA